MYFKKLNKEGKDITTQHNRIRTDLESHMLNIFINYLETLFPVPTKSSRNEFIKKSLITVIHISTALYITTASIMATAHTSAFFCLHRGTLQVSLFLTVGHLFMDYKGCQKRCLHMLTHDLCLLFNDHSTAKLISVLLKTTREVLYSQ